MGFVITKAQLDGSTVMATNRRVAECAKKGILTDTKELGWIEGHLCVAAAVIE